jgi:hypothetical protein
MTAMTLPRAGDGRLAGLDTATVALLAGACLERGWHGPVLCLPGRVPGATMRLADPFPTRVEGRRALADYGRTLLADRGLAGAPGVASVGVAAAVPGGPAAATGGLS